MLQNLTNKQVEKALEWLANPVSNPPPDPLDKLNQAEWYLLNQLLEKLLLEKQHNLLH